jgi:MFS family permease
VGLEPESAKRSTRQPMHFCVCSNPWKTRSHYIYPDDDWQHTTKSKGDRATQRVTPDPSMTEETQKRPAREKERGATDPEFLRANLGNLLVLTGSVMFVLLPEYLQSQRMQKWEIGLVDGSFWFISIFVQPWLGPRLDKDGRKIFLCGGSLLMAAAATSYAWLPAELVPMITARLIHGLGFACYLTASWTWVADYAPPHRVGEMFGVFGISGLLSGTLGPGIAEVLVRRYGYDHLFFYGAGFMFVGWLVLLTLKDRRPDAASKMELPGFFKLLRARGMRGSVVGSIAFGVAIGAIFAFVAPYLATIKVEGVGPLFACTTLASGASRILAGKMTDRLGPGRLVTPALFMLAVGTAGLAQVQNSGPTFMIPVLVLSGLAAGLGYGIVYPALNALAICRLTPAARGRGLSLVTASIDCGSTGGAAIAGFLIHSFGFPNGFRSIGLLVLALCFAFWLAEKNQSEECEAP